MLYFINQKNPGELTRVKATNFAEINWKEKDLETLISENINGLIPENQLMVICREKPFGEAADIFALDKKGDLYLFELKRWQSDKENLLQVLRYGQIFGQYSYEQLEGMLRAYTKKPELKLNEIHSNYFEDAIDSNLNPAEFNREQHFIVITNGVDRETLDAIKYWQNKGLKVDTIIYRLYNVEGKIIFEFNPYNPEQEVIWEPQEGYFIVNTNITWSKENYREMIAQEKAAAYYDRKYGIANIKKNDTVFLYHNRVGIVAYGKATESHKTADIGPDKAAEYYIKLKFDWKIDPDREPNRAVKAWQINNELKSGYRFRQTVFAISEEMAKAIKSMAKPNGK